MTDYWDFEVGRRTAWMEARGETAVGWTGVLHVLLNRVKDGRWGKTLAEVCLAPEQFSGWNTKDPNRIEMARVADNDPLLGAIGDGLDAALSGLMPDPTDGATHYCRFDLDPMPDWTVGATLTRRIGNHNFYKDVK